MKRKLKYQRKSSYLFTKGQNGRLVQFESVRRRQNLCYSKIEICFGKAR